MSEQLHAWVRDNGNLILQTWLSENPGRGLPTQKQWDAFAHQQYVRANKTLISNLSPLETQQ